ncbi:MAG TPA: hypothetical protein PKE03_07640 [Bacteroidales bacterium]|nr:hypothetical protein [Bacteroidales bacterium]
MKSIFLPFFLLLPLWLVAQSPETDFFRKSLHTNQTGMYVLGSWAIANMAIGAVGMARTEGSAKHFHQMNLAWNVVNLGIAGYALWNFSQQDISSTPFPELADEHLRIKRLYLINAGLDVFYVAAGAYLWHRSAKAEKRPELLRGFGRAVVLQGGFLLVFDAAMYLLQQGNENKFPGLISAVIAL